MGKKKKQSPNKITPKFQTAPFWDKYPYLFLSGILVLALILRFTALSDMQKSIYSGFLLWDERIYHDWAIKIADGSFQSSSVYEFAPLPAYIMALIYKLLSPDILYIRILNIIYNVLTCWLVYLLGKEMANRMIGLLACAIACLSKEFIFFSIVPLKTSLSIFLFALTIYLFVSIINKYSIIKTLLLGVAIGLLLNVRPNVIIIIPFMPLVFLWNAYKDKKTLKQGAALVILYVLGLSLSISPFIIRNYRVSGEIAMTASQYGFNIYLANNLKVPGPYYLPVPFASPSPQEQGIQFTIEASKRLGKNLSPQEASTYWSQEVIRMAKEQPAAFAWKICQKAIVFCQKYQPANMYNIDFISQFVTFFKTPFFTFGFILPFGMAGMAVTIMRSRKLLALSAVFLLYASSLIIYFTTARYRAPVLIILIPFAVIGMANLFSSIKRKQFRDIAVYAAIAVTFLIIEFLPIQGKGDMTAYYNTHAINLSEKGYTTEAVQYWENSSRMNGRYSVFADLILAQGYYQDGDIKGAIAHLNRISDESFAAAYKYEIIGDEMLNQKNLQMAIAAYERSLTINSGLRSPRIKLIRIYRTVDPVKALREEEKLKVIESFYNVL